MVRDKRGDGHAVLTVKTDKGEFVLDNQNDQILLWSDTGYRFVKRQSQTDQNVWVSLGEPRGTQTNPTFGAIPRSAASAPHTLTVSLSRQASSSASDAAAMRSSSQKF